MKEKRLFVIAAIVLTVFTNPCYCGCYYSRLTSGLDAGLKVAHCRIIEGNISNDTQVLMIEWTPMITLPENIIRGLRSLRKIVFSYNKLLTSLPENIFKGLTSLQTIDVSNNIQLASLPENIFKGLTSLKTLIISGNHINHLTENIFKNLTNLQTFHLSNNRLLTSLPENIFKGLKNLQTIRLSNNRQIASLPENIFKGLTGLKTIDILNNIRLASLLENIFKELTSLQNLVISGNRIRFLPENIFKHLKNLKKADISNNRQLSSLDENIFQGLTSLETVIISGNRISSFSDNTFKGLKSLQTLTISNNRQLASFPKNIFQGLTSLHTITLNRNRLTSLPYNVFIDLTNLRSIDLSKNTMTNFPETIFNGLRRLKTIDLSYNSNLYSLPEKIFNGLESIKTINLAQNPLTSLPENIFIGLTSLQTINLFCTKPISLPKNAFTGLISLKTIISASISIHCTYDSVYQIWRLKKLGILRSKFSCVSQEMEVDDFIFKKELTRDGSNVSKSINREFFIRPNGSREIDSCGTKDNPCQLIADVLFKRRGNVTIYLISEKTKSLKYFLKLPLEVYCTINIKKYPSDSVNPIIESKQPVIFLMQNNERFTSDGVDFDIPSRGVVLKLDTQNFISINLLNTLIKSPTSKSHVTAVSMESQQSLQTFFVSNTSVPGGSLFHLQGKRFLKRRSSITVNKVTISHSNATSLFIIEGFQCNLNKISIDNCDAKEYGIVFKNNDGYINQLTISNNKIRRALVLLGRITPEFTSYYRGVVNYMTNRPRNAINNEHTKAIAGSFGCSLRNTHLNRNKAAKIFEITDRFYDGSDLEKIKPEINISNLTVIDNEAEFVINSENFNFRLHNITIEGNNISKNIISHKNGNFHMSSIYIKKNMIEYASVPIFYAARDSSQQRFSLINAYINGTREDNNLLLLDLYLGNGQFKLKNVTIESNANRRVTAASVIIGLSHDPTSAISNLQIKCRSNSDALHAINDNIRGKSLEVSCNPCPINKYTNQKTFLNITNNIYNKSNHIINNLLPETNNNFECYNCPIGGSCNHGIKSSGNFYGYNTTQGKVVFKPCPKNYCCTNKNCIAIDSCSKNREGVLCGECRKGFQVDFFSDDCMEEEKCSEVTKFWLFLQLATLVVCLLFLYNKNMIWCSKKLWALMKTSLPRWKKNKIRQEFTIESNANRGVTAVMIGLSHNPTFTISNFQINCRENSDAVHTINNNIHGKLPTAPTKGNVMILEGETKDQVTLFGCFNIIVGFYQIRSLLAIGLVSKYERSESFQTKITKFFNLDFNFDPTICPMGGLNPIYKGLIKNHVTVLSMICWAFILLTIYYANQLIRYMFSCRSNEIYVEGNNATFPEKLGLTVLKIVLFGYKNVATFSIVLIHCVEIKEKEVLFIYGRQECYHRWQIAWIVFVLVWIVPFPATLMLSYRLYKNHVITFRKFLLCSAVPFVAVVYYFRLCKAINVFIKKEDRQQEVYVLLSEYFEEPYRSTKKNNHHCVSWETWRLYQRLILAFIVTCTINPINRICYIAPVILFFIMVYWIVLPYKTNLNILHWMEAVSLLGITFSLVNNTFRSFLYVFQIPDEHPIPISLNTLYWIDSMASPIFVLPYFYVVKPFFRYIRRHIF